MPKTTTIPYHRDQPADAQKLYDKRSTRYDSSWHPRFARHIVELISPQPGESVLDLACGTGLVTFPAADAAGPDGKVIGVDISSGMLNQARSKQAKANTTNVHFFNHSVTDLTTLDPIRDEKFDILTCVSALVLFPNAAEALKQWTSRFLKPGGRVVVDVPHPRCQLGFLTLERVGKALNRPVPSYRLPFQQPSDLESMLAAAGLESISIRLLSQQDRAVNGNEDEDSDRKTEDLRDFICDLAKPVLGDAFEAREADLMFEKVVDTTYGEVLAGEDVRPKAKKLFRREWAKLVGDGSFGGVPGTIEEVDGVYVGIGYRAVVEGRQSETVLGKRKADCPAEEDRQGVE